MTFRAVARSYPTPRAFYLCALAAGQSCIYTIMDQITEQACRAGLIIGQLVTSQSVNTEHFKPKHCYGNMVYTMW